MPNRIDDEVDKLELEVPTSYGKDQRRGWHFDKTVSIADLFTIIIICVPLLTWAVNIESRFSTFQERFINIERQRSEDQNNTKDRLGDLQQQLRTMDSRVNEKVDKMNDKLDRISDKVGAATHSTPTKLVGDR